MQLRLAAAGFNSRWIKLLLCLRAFHPFTPVMWSVSVIVSKVRREAAHSLATFTHHSLPPRKLRQRSVSLSHNPLLANFRLRHLTHCYLQHWQNKTKQHLTWRCKQFSTHNLFFYITCSGSVFYWSCLDFICFVLFSQKQSTGLSLHQRKDSVPQVWCFLLIFRFVIIYRSYDPSCYFVPPPDMTTVMTVLAMFDSKQANFISTCFTFVFHKLQNCLKGRKKNLTFW